VEVGRLEDRETEEWVKLRWTLVRYCEVGRWTELDSGPRPVAVSELAIPKLEGHNNKELV
jgi:hypothetical protein